MAQRSRARAHDVGGGKCRRAHRRGFLFAGPLEDAVSNFKSMPVTRLMVTKPTMLWANRRLPPLCLYLDKESGLLLRLIRYAETPLGRNPTQIDYADYRDANGVKMPFRWTLARPGNRFIIQIEQVQQNFPVDDAKFAPHPLQRLLSLRVFPASEDPQLASLSRSSVATDWLRLSCGNSGATSPEVSCCESFEYPRDFVPKL